MCYFESEAQLKKAHNNLPYMYFSTEVAEFASAGQKGFQCCGSTAPVEILKFIFNPDIPCVHQKAFQFIFKRLPVYRQKIFQNII